MSGELETWSNILHSLLEGFVKRRGHDVLKDQLPSKEEPVDSFRPGESSPVPVMTCQASASSAPDTDPYDYNFLVNFGLKCLQRLAVGVYKIVTRRDSPGSEPVSPGPFPAEHE